ncbi:MAG: ATP-binding protein [Candidatus Omnitrophica bacterium]|jgi:MinD superfamily P-loop ATPase|nr:ATP-binding protein [Candidatus Omnitrophota bacterium]MDD5525974.1 ATP-binding protein [Candidatus Omnitrophota bacterium]
MRKIAVVSGKGGTGKTVVAASFAALPGSKVMVDCDVDAADLHLLLHPEIKERHEFRGGSTAVIDRGLCRQCGKCSAVCRFKAVKSGPRVERFFCEGCGLCARLCPYGAIRMEETVSGEWFVSGTRRGSFVHARLGVAQGNSGRLVAQIRRAAERIAEEEKLEYVVIDGPPGIGCPVIASLSGVDCALVVTEPSLSGLHDARRVIETAAHFAIPVKLAVNKYDLNPEMSVEIEDFCRGKGIQFVGRIPFDPAVVEALSAGRNVIDSGNSPAGDEIRKIWELLIR